MIDACIAGLLRYAEDTGLIEADDRLWARNRLLEALQLDGCGEVMQLPFRDVPEDAYYYDAVVWATEAGVVNGMGDGTFAPNDNITRQEMATMLYRLAKAEKVEEDKLASFPDAASVADWAKDAMNWAVSTEIVNGSTHDDKVNYLDPTATALRCQAAAVACRYLALSK